MNKAVYINRIARFLPGKPVSNDEIEEYLGFVDGKKSRSKSIVLRNNKITTRYYAMDKNKKSTHSNAELAAESIRALCTRDFKLDDIELLACGTASPDQIIPAHGVMVHGLLKSRPVETITFSGACCTSMNALKYSYMSILTGNSKNAVTSGSEKLSTWMISQKFEEEALKLKELEADPLISFEKDFLRWMLSDGSAAALLTDTPNPDGISLKIEGIDICSFANESETCMYAGSDKDAEGNIHGWNEYEPKEWIEKSIFAMKQDPRLLEKNINKFGTIRYIELLKKHNLDPKDVDWFLPHISSEYFRSRVDDAMKNSGVGLPPEKWFVNLSSVGNIGSASIFVALKELMESGKLKKGQKIMLSVPESARFSYGNALLTVV
jgi:3-oxoacyl-[acyl-carrier-protein] synthase-3